MSRMTCHRGPALSFVCILSELTTYITTFIRALLAPGARLAALLLAAESQLAAHTLRIQQKKEPKPRFTPGFRLLWVALSVCWDGWKEHAHLMEPATVKKWHTRVFRVYWRRKSRERLGRPPLGQEMQDLIRTLSKEHPLWGQVRTLPDGMSFCALRTTRSCVKGDIFKGRSAQDS